MLKIWSIFEVPKPKAVQATWYQFLKALLSYFQIYDFK